MADNERSMTTGSEQIEAPSSMGSFFSTLPKEGNVKTEEVTEENKTKDVKTPEELAAEEQAKGDGKGDDEDDEPEKKEESKKEINTTKRTAPEEKEENLDSVLYKIAEAFSDIEIEGELEDNENGIIEVTRQIASKNRELGKAEGKEELYAKNPLIKVVADHLEMGGSLVSLIQQKEVENFSKIEIKEEDKTTQERLFRQALIVKGLDEDLIDTLVNTAKDDGTLHSQAGKAKDFLVDKQSEIVNKQLELEKKQKADELAEAKENENKVRNILKEGKLNGFTISKDVANRLEDYTLKVDSKGQTAREKAYENLTVDEWLTLDMIVMEKFKPLTGLKQEAPAKTPVKFTIKKSTPVVKVDGSSKGVQAELNKLGISNARDLFK